MTTHATIKDDAAPPLASNEVVLVGRLAGEPQSRELPSGTEIMTFRLVVERAPTVMTRGSRQKSDWMDCTAWGAAQRRRVSAWRPDDVVEVRGSLRRRHYRGPVGGGSRVEIEVLGARMVRRAPTVPSP